MRGESGQSAIAQSVVFSAYGDGGGVMQEAIQQRSGEDRMVGEVAPGGVGFVGGEDDRV